MKTTKDILTENRESVISSIKWVFKVWKSEDLKIKMIEFMNYCNEYPETVQNADVATNTKTLLKYMVQKMSIAQKEAQPKDTRKWYEIAEDIADQRGLVRDSLTGKMYKI